MTDTKAIATAPGKPTERKALSAKERAEKQKDEFDFSKKLLEGFLPEYRYKMEIGGIIVSGTAIPTDRETQAKLIAMRIKAKEDANYVVNFKTPNGFVTLDAATIIVIADAVHDHVQKCFNAESAIDPNDYNSATEIKAAFDNVYGA